MSKVHMLRDFVNQRLTLAAEEIFELFERTMVEYEEELCRQGKLLNAVFQPEVRLHREDVQQLMVNREAVPPEQQIWSPSLDQQNPPELPNIKEEQEEQKELWTKQEEEQLQLLEEADITKFTLTPSKSEDEEEKPETSLLHQSQTEELRDAEHLKNDADEEHSRRSEPDRNLNPDNCLETATKTATNDETPHFPEPETDDSNDWEEMRDSESDLKPLQNNEVLLSDKEINTGETSVTSSEHTANFGHEGRLQKQKHNEAQTGVSSFSCSVCGKGYHKKKTLRNHMRLHSATNFYSCSVCTKTFLWRIDLNIHMRIHTGEKPFSCCFCGKKFTQRSGLTSHLRIHTGEKPFQCSICKVCFRNRGNLDRHIRVHSGEKPFICSICGKTFCDNGQLRVHLRTHTGEKPFGCLVCGKRFAQGGNLRRHVMTHTGEKPFGCSVCGKRFAQHVHLRAHSNVHTGEKPFHCRYCNERFSQLYMLQKHKCVGLMAETNKDLLFSPVTV